MTMVAYYVKFILLLILYKDRQITRTHTNLLREGTKVRFGKKPLDNYSVASHPFSLDDQCMCVFAMSVLCVVL